MTRRQILESLHRGTVSLSDAREGILRQATNGEGTGRPSVETPKINKPTEAAALKVESLQDELVESLAAALYMEVSDIERDVNFTDMGLDSIVGVEWINVINKRHGIKVPATKVYDYPTIQQLADYLMTVIPVTPAPEPERIAPPVILPRRDKDFSRPDTIYRRATRRESAARNRPKVSPPGSIAIVGMSGRYPGATDLDAFWKNLAAGHNSIREIPRERWEVEDYYDPDPSKPGKVYCKWLGALDDIDCFDAPFFMVSRAEAEGMDPQYRIFLEESHKAFEHAGYSARSLSDKNCGVYMGIMNSEYVHLLSPAQTQGLNTGNSHSIAAARISYFLNLKGPAIPIDTACSSSLVATHLACQALRNGEIEMALVGGVTLYLTPASYVGMCAAGMLSPDGQCKTFDNGANGFVPGEGAGALVLKRLEDAQRDHDCIHGVILGSGINQDGRTNGITAPSVHSQIELERDVYQRFGIDPATIDYVETHGTGTKLGDPVELEALTTVFRERTKRRNFCGLGSVKSNIGHTSAAAGMAGVQKMLLCFQHQKLVPSLHFKEANTHCDFEDSPFYVNTETKPWRAKEGAPRRAAISSMGFSGTNAHLVIEEYQDPRSANAPDETAGPWPIILSAKDEDRLRQAALNLRTYLATGDHRPSMRDLAYTLQLGRDEMAVRLALVAHSADDLADKLDRVLAGTSPVGEVFQARVPRSKGKLALHRADAALKRRLAAELEHRDYDALLERWVKGLVFDWTQLHQGDQPYRVSLPTYPFARERYWVADTVTPKSAKTGGVEGASTAFKLFESGDGIWCIRGDDQAGPIRSTRERVGDLTTCIASLRGRPEVRVVLLQGDAHGILGGENTDAQSPWTQDLAQVLTDCDVPLIAVLTHYGVGVDWRVASHCDFLVCAEEMQGEISTAQSGAEFEAVRTLLVDRFGERIASEMMRSGRRFRGWDLKAAGATFPIVPQDEVAASALSLAREIAEAPRESVRQLRHHLSRQRIVAMTAEVRDDEDQSSTSAFPESGAPTIIDGVSDVVKFERFENGVVVLTLQDTASKNSFSRELSLGLVASFDRIREDLEAKVVVMTGYGNYFACGGTREALQAIQRGQAKFTDLNISSLPLECNIPVIAAMQGHGIGAGWTMGLFCDHTIYGSESTYHSPYLRYGFTPGAGSTRIVPERLGRDLGWEILFTAREFSGAELQARGASDLVLPRAEVMSAAMQMAHRIARSSRDVLVTRKTARVGPLREQMASVFEHELAMHDRTFVGNQEVQTRINRHFHPGAVPAAATGPERRLVKPTGLILSQPISAPQFEATSHPVAVQLPSPENLAGSSTPQTSVLKSRDVLDDLKSTVGGRSDLVPTLNRTGVMLGHLTLTSQAFVVFAETCQGEVLDIGCAYGVATLPALAKGATVLAVDMEAQHLEILLERVSNQARARLRTERGVLPEVDFVAGRFAAIHAARVLHFLSPEDVQVTLRKMWNWLQPGGGLFLVSDTPYVGFWKSQANNYETRKAKGDLWPGYIDEVEQHFDATQTTGAPRSINALDPDVLRRECEAVGFEVEQAGFETSGMESNLADLQAAGREHAGIIARKPQKKSPSAGQTKLPSSNVNPASIRRYLRQSLAEALHTTADQIDEDTPFVELGVDSVICVMWVRGINTRYQLTIGATRIYDYPSVREFAVFIEEERAKHGAEGDLEEDIAVAPLPDVESDRSARPQPYGLVLSQAHVFTELALKPWPVAPPGVGEVSIQVRASAVSFTDTICVRGLYPAPYPFVPGLEVAGVVMAVGVDAGDLQVGDEVIALTAGHMGGHAERVNVPDSHVVRKPHHLSFEDACSLPLAFGVAYHGLERLAKLAPQEHVLIHTTTGGVGLMALQLARLKGCVCYGTSSREEKRELLEQLGVPHVLNYQASDFGEQIRRLSNDRGVDVVLNTVTGDAMQQGLDALANAGRYLELATHALATNASADSPHLRSEQSRQVVTFLELLSREEGSAVQTLLQTMVAWTESGRIVPTVTRVYPLKRIAEALAFVAEGNHQGKVVISHTVEEMEDRQADCLANLETQRQRAAEENRGPVPMRASVAKATSAPPSRQKERSLEGIAIVGMSGRFPKSPTVDAFWENLAAGRDCISEIPASRWSIEDYYDPDPSKPGKTCSKWMGVLEDVDRFDPLFFQISPAEARMMDPQQRVFLQSCWSCLEDAAINPRNLSGSNCGVFAGCGTGDYGMGAERDGVIGATGVSPSILPARVSYLLNLKGPCQAIDTSCSSSLVAMANACDSLLLGNCDMALAGGVLIMTSPALHVGMSQGGMLSPDGRCFTFDERANGFVPGEGVGVVLLKRLSDAVHDGDNIHGVIKGWGMNQDGKTNGITAPSMNSQAALERNLYERFELDPATISLVEAHGTGTRLGDPIEVEALSAAFRASTQARRFCALGSVKSNIGHLGTGAGVAGLIKVLLALRHRTLPPTLHFNKLNPHIPLEGSPFYVNTEARPWKTSDGQPRRASVSSFGFSGTNAHLVVEEAPERTPAPVSSLPGLIVLSALTAEALRESAEGLLTYLSHEQTGDAVSLHDLAYTLQVGREAMGERLALRVDSREVLLAHLRAYLAGEPVVGLYRDQVKRHRAEIAEFIADDKASEVVARWILEKNYDAILARWTQGFDLDWDQLYPGKKPRRISLPTYPFARERCWLGESPAQVPTPTSTMLLARPIWQDWDEEVKVGPGPNYDRRILMVGGFDPTTMAGLSRQISSTECILLSNEITDAAEGFQTAAEQVFEVLRGLLNSKLKGHVLVQVLVPASGEQSRLAGLSGLLKTVRKENPQVVAQIVASDEVANAATLLQEVAGAPHESQFRFSAGRWQIPALVELEDASRESPSLWQDRGVYLITGGAGGLGLIMAEEIVAKVAHPTLILVARSEPSVACRQTVAEWAERGANVVFRRVDVADAAAVSQLVAQIQADHGSLNGVIHAAGIIRDNFIIKKTTAEVREVLAPKVAGAVNLIRATQNSPLDFMVFFSSGAGVTGNAGQGDYAAANAFLDGLATEESGRPTSRRMVAINWPLWRDGGMHVDPATERLIRQQTGMSAMDTSDGLQAFYHAMASTHPQVMVVAGDAPRIRRSMLQKPSPAPSATPPAVSPSVNRERSAAAVLQQLKQLLGDIIDLPMDRIESDEPLERYGIDSVMVTRLNQQLGRVIPDVSQTLFFEFSTLNEIATFLVEAFPAETAAWTQAPEEHVTPRATLESKPVSPVMISSVPAPMDPGVQEPIAIIGICGRYAQAESLEEYWANLAAGKDCVTEIPPERWALDGFYEADPAVAIRTGQSYSKWGSFLTGFAEFDPLFFNISPVEALGMDPQERLFLQSAWEVLESAGYTRQRLADVVDRDVGVFAGVTRTGFDQYRADWRRQGEMVTPYTSFGSVANRVSYVLNLKGPSMPVDTMCSSSLTAIHEACEHLRRGDCRMAIAGGVNLYLHPSSYVGLCAQRMLSPDGKCRSFGEGGNGFVPGEGVGMVLLKPLAQAMADRDPIQAVIRGTSVNHGGKTNGYTVPNPNAQRDVIRAALEKAGIDARHVSYLEAHGTGTELGDPIEVTGLTQAFAQDTKATEFCALGSAKSNLGHLEAAAGIAGLTKVVLQLRHGQLVPSLHAGVLNPKIPFAKTPFRLQRELTDWVRPAVTEEGGTTQVRRIAGVSSFGAGGSNAHVLLEEPPPPMPRPMVPQPGPALVVLSAKTPESLSAYAVKLEKFLGVVESSKVNLPQLAYTLQAGREAMEERLALVVTSFEQLREKLTDFVANPDQVSGCHRGRIARGDKKWGEFFGDEDLAETISTWWRKKKWDRIAALWVQGGTVDWDSLYGGEAPSRIELPTYPFARERYWVDLQPTAHVGQAHLHPMVQTNASDIEGLRFTGSFSGNEFFMADHVVNGVKVLPGVAYLEMARFAATTVRGKGGADVGRVVIRNVIWARPLTMTQGDIAVHVRLADVTTEGMGFSILSEDLAGERSVVHSQGLVTVGGAANSSTLDMGMLRSKFTGETLSGRECYTAFASMGVVYGAGFQAIQEVFTGEGQVLARLELPTSVAATKDHYGLHPSLLDGALQACIGLSKNASAEVGLAEGTAVPFALDALEIVSSKVVPCWVWVRACEGAGDSAAGSKWDITLADESGRIGVELRGLTFRSFEDPESSPSRVAEIVLLATPVWHEQPIAVDAVPVNVGESLVLLADLPMPPPDMVAAIWPEATFQSLRVVGGDPAERVTAAASDAFEIIRDRLVGTVGRKEQFVQVVIPNTAGGKLFSALAGLLKTMTLENPHWQGQVIAVDPDESAEAQLQTLRDNRTRPADERIRYQAGKREVLTWVEAAAERADTVAEQARWKDGGTYLLTGGAGGLGLIFAEAIAHQTTGARLVLCGRSELGDEQQRRLKTIREHGAQVDYHLADLSRPDEVEALIEAIVTTHGRIDGVIHAAGILRDRLMGNKSTEEFREVLAPKVAGAVNLDHACRELDLDFFILFAAGAGVLGNPGQADYATANAFLDAFAVHRNERVAAGQVQGHTLSLDWPWWQEGGMRMDATAIAVMRDKLGLTPLQKAEGIEALQMALATPHDQVLVAKGDLSRLRTWFERVSMSPSTPVAETRGPEVAAVGSVDTTVEERTIAALRALLSSALRVPVSRIHPDEVMSDLGIDSVVVMNLTNQLEEKLGSLSKTLFFEHQSVRALARYFAKNHAAKLDGFIALPEPNFSPDETSQTVPETKAREADPAPIKTTPMQAMPELSLPTESPKTGTLDVAIIGLSGRYPQAGNLDAFWKVLREGRDCITEVPSDRWDWRDYYSEDPAQPRGHSSKWGGFIDDVDKFDPQFFNLSPRIAPYLDPQERLMLEETWKALEDAGYRREDLQAGEGDEAWSPVGVYVGAMYGEYQLLGAEASLSGHRLGFAGNLASIANRVSYLLNLHGPSMMVDTMCSSSLTCIHLACQDLVAGRTNYAIAGGVNVTIHPNKYLMLSGGQFLSAAGRCESFGEGGAGYIPSEGVGVAVLKRLADAERDGDHIYGVIKASAVNHGGRTHGYSVPNPKAQEQVVAQALREARIDPRAVSYIEAHGTGTKLGDPIEIAGLARAFGRQPTDMRCWIGSAKSNIGHCESAAGIAGLTKVLLQMKHRQIAPSLHSRVLNPHIDFAPTPFAVNQVLRDWEPPQIEGQPGARIAGVSSFGAGGSNAHLLVEEYTPSTPAPRAAVSLRGASQAGPGRLFPIVLSAKTEDRLIEVVRGVRQYLEHPEATSPAWLEQLAYTLQVGREAMTERLGFVVTTLAELRAKLDAFVGGRGDESDFARGRVEDGGIEAGAAPVDVYALVAHWAKGGHVDWHRRHGSQPPGRISLPTYPFVRKRYWAEFDTTAVPVGEEGAPGATPVNVIPVSLHPPTARPVDPDAVPLGKPRGVALTPLSSPLKNVSELTLQKKGSAADRVMEPSPSSEQRPPAPPPTGAVEPKTPEVSPASIPSDLQAALLTSLAKALFLEEAELSLDKPFLDLGLDSIVGVEWVNAINRQYGLSIPANQVYEHPNLRQFTGYVGGLMAASSSSEPETRQPTPVPEAPRMPETNTEPTQSKAAASPTASPPVTPPPAKVAAPRLRPRANDAKTTDIAIVGMAGRFPGGPTLDTFWELLQSGQTAFSAFPTDRDWDWSGYDQAVVDRVGVERGGFLQDVDRFDPLFFQISPKEAMTMDPGERIFLEEAWKAIEDAGIVPTDISGRRWGVFCGNGGDYSLRIHDAVGYSPHVTLAQVPSRVSHCLNLSGPCQSNDASCASALLSIAQACDQLVMGNCEAALAGGVLVHSTPNLIVSASQVEMLAGNGASGGALDRRAKGMLPGEAAGVLVLKPLADAQAAGDRIHGIIEGWGSNHNGRTNGMVSPSSEAQETLFSEVYDRFEIDPASISMVEANAGGLTMADDAEVQALSRAFSQRGAARGSCVLGSVENNVGHAFHASGMSHLMKVLLSLRHGQIPATPNVGEPISALTEENCPFFVNDATIPWDNTEGQSRRAAVNSFGATGTNVHLVIAESRRAPMADKPTSADATESVLIPLSAKTAEGLKQRCRDLADRLRVDSDEATNSLRGLSANLLLRRSHFEHRCAVVAADRATLRQRLREIAEGGPVVDGFVGVVEPNPRLQPALSLLAESKVDSLAAGSSDPADQRILADLYVQGVLPDVAVCFSPKERTPWSLPTYPFAKRRCWIAAAPRAGEVPVSPCQENEEMTGTHAVMPKIELCLEILVGYVMEITGLSADEIDPRLSLGACGVDSLLGMRLLNRINARFGGQFDASLLVQETIIGVAKEIARQGGPSTAVEMRESAAPDRWVRPKFVQALTIEVSVDASSSETRPAGEDSLEKVIAGGVGVWREKGTLFFEFLEGTKTAATLRELVPQPNVLHAALAEGCRYFPVSDMQRLALRESEEAKRTNFNLCQAFWVDLPVDRQSLQAALDDLVRRHAIFRTRFSRAGAQWLQVVQDDFSLVCREVCWPSVETQEQFLAKLSEYQRTRSGHLYDLADGPMVDVTFLHNDADLGAVCFSAHHAHADGFTLYLFQQELFARYTARCGGERFSETAAAAEYVHFALTQQAPERAEVARYWLDKMAKHDAALRMSDAPTAVEAVDAGTGVMDLVIDSAMLARLQAFNRSNDTTLTQLITVALATLLQRLTGRCPPIQMVYNLRDRTEFESLLGDFSASAPLVLEMTFEHTLRDVVEMYRRMALELQQHKHFDFTVLLKAKNGGGVGVALDSNDRDAFGGVTDFAERLIDIAMADREPVAPLLVCVVKTHGRLTLPMMFDRARFTPHSMDLFAGNLRAILGQLIQDPEITVGAVEVLPELTQRLSPA